MTSTKNIPQQSTDSKNVPKDLLKKGRATISSVILSIIFVAAYVALAPIVGVILLLWSLFDPIRNQDPELTELSTWVNTRKAVRDAKIRELQAKRNEGLGLTHFREWKKRTGRARV